MAVLFLKKVNKLMDVSKIGMTKGIVFIFSV